MFFQSPRLRRLCWLEHFDYPQIIGCLASRISINIAEPQSVDNDFLPDIQTELSYDMPRPLDRVLASFVSTANPQGAWLAIRHGDTLDIAAHSNDTRSIGISLSVKSNPLLHRMNRTHAEIAVKKRDSPSGIKFLIRKSSPIRRYGVVFRSLWASD